MTEECLHAASGSRTAIPSEWSFASLIHPVTVEEFCGAYWARKPLVIQRTQPSFYKDLVSLRELERYLSLGEFFEVHSSATPARDEAAPSAPPSSISEVYDRMASGNSLRLRHMERFLDPASAPAVLLRSMEQTLEHPCDSLSCYVAPPSARGLGPHHDETEIFTLQISGTKRWRLFHRVDTDECGLHEPEQLREPADEFVLQAGDFFYMPRGVVHDVRATNEPSFSLTIVFSPFTWASVLDLVTDRLRRTSDFIAPMPARVVSGGQGPSFRAELERRLDLIRRELLHVDESAISGELGPKLVRRMTMPPGSQLEDIFDLGLLNLQTKVERRRGIVCHLARNAETVTLTMPGGYVVQASQRAEPALLNILAAEQPFQVSSIGGGLSSGAKVMLAKKLVACGLLTTATQQERQAI